jgi:hypothetical protein
MCALAYLGKQKCGFVVGSESRINGGINVLKHVERIDENIAFSDVRSIVVDLAFSGAGVMNLAAQPISVYFGWVLNSFCF